MLTPSVENVPSTVAGVFPRPASRSLERHDDRTRAADAVLIRQAQHGNLKAFEELVRHYDKAVLRLAFHLTGSEQDAQDVCQEAFLNAYRNLSNFRFECSFYTWILSYCDQSVARLAAKAARADLRLARGERSPEQPS